MKVYVLTKRNVILILSSIFSGIGLILMTLNILFTSAGEKKLPIYRVNKPLDENEQKRVSISFDAAWGSDKTNEILSTLKKYEVKATFFLVKLWADKYPDLVKKISEAGNDVGNHSTTHPNMTKLSKEKCIKELKDCSDAIEKITGKGTELFRPPFGAYNNTVLDAAEELKMFTIQWDVDSLDWMNRTPEQMMKKIKDKSKNGSIILFHNNGKFTSEVLPEVLKYFQENNFKVVPLSQLIYRENYKISLDGSQVQIND